MDVQLMLSEKLVDLDVSYDTSEDLLGVMADRLLELGYVKANYKQELLKREQTYPTGLETKSVDVAIPHTEREFVNKPFIYVSRILNRIPFSKMGTEPGDQDYVYPRFVFLIGLNTGDLHVLMLQALVKIFTDEEKMTVLNESNSKEEIYNLLCKYIELGDE